MNLRRTRVSINAGGRIPFAWLEVAIDGVLDDNLRAAQGRAISDLDVAVRVEIQMPKGVPTATLRPSSGPSGRWILGSREGHVEIRGIHLPITREQLDYIEEHRNGDLACSVHLAGRILSHDKQSSDIRIEEFYSSDDHRIPQSEWVNRFLGPMGYATYDILEMRLDHIEAHPALSRASNHLEEALGAFHNGRVTEPMTKTRQALEAIEKALKDGDGLDEYAKRVLAKGRHATSRPQHDQSQDPPPTRADAEMALYLGRAALRWAAHRMQ